MRLLSSLCRYHCIGKLTSNLKPFAINSVLPKGRGGFTKSKVITTTLNTFMASADKTITTRHVPSTHITNTGCRNEIHEGEKQVLYEHMNVFSDTTLMAIKPVVQFWLKRLQMNDKPQYRLNLGFFIYRTRRLHQPKLCEHWKVIFVLLTSILSSQLFVHDAQNIWNKMKDLVKTNNDAYFMTHDGKLTENEWNWMSIILL